VLLAAAAAARQNVEGAATVAKRRMRRLPYPKTAVLLLWIHAFGKIAS
jgi:hypothetical protein